MTFALLFQLAASASAQICIGQAADFSGRAAVGVKESTASAKLYFDEVNKNGGINGQQIEPVSLDDKFDPALAAQNARRLIADRKVVALFLTRRTPHTEAILPVLKEFAVPLVGPSTGATQVFPSERSISVLMVKAALDQASAQGLTEISPSTLKGSAAAKVLVEGLRRSGSNPTSQKLITALNGLRKLDIGGLKVGFSADHHTGLVYAELSIVGRNGRFHR